MVLNSLVLLLNLVHSFSSIPKIKKNGSPKIRIEYLQEGVHQLLDVDKLFGVDEQLLGVNFQSIKNNFVKPFSSFFVSKEEKIMQKF